MWHFAGLSKKGRDIETEDMLEELHGKIRELERLNMQLKEKVRSYYIRYANSRASAQDSGKMCQFWHFLNLP